MWYRRLHARRPQSERGEPQSESHYIEGVRERLLEAGQLRLEADVPVACYLSGGIDSCSILGLSAASQQRRSRPSLSASGSDYDETAIARQMAQSAGTDQDVLMLDSGHLYDNFAETMWHTERTIYNTLGMVVTGEVSDELLGGCPGFRRDMFLHGLDTLSDAECASWQQLLDESNRLFSGAMLAEQALHDPALNRLVGFTQAACNRGWPPPSTYRV